VVNVLLFIKKIFHLEENYNLRTNEEAYNRQALDMYIANFALFVKKCQDCVDES
jgi:hypothetical protein